MSEIERLQKQLDQEKLLKMQAVSKLAEVMARKDNHLANKKGTKQESWTTNLKKRDKEYRKLNIDLQTVRIYLLLCYMLKKLMFTSNHDVELSSVLK